MQKLSVASRRGLGFSSGAFLVLIIQLFVFLPSGAYISIVWPATIIVGLVIFIIGYKFEKKELKFNLKNLPLYLKSCKITSIKENLIGGI